MYPLTLPRGEVRIETSLVPVLDADKTVVSLVATMQDRTAERQLELQRVETEARMKSMERELEDYISFAAHDLRTPMRHVQQIASLLREDFEDHGDGKLELIEMLEDVGVKASTLISDVLSFARSGANEEPRTSVDLSYLSANLFAVLDPQKRYGMTCDDGLIEIDGTALQIVLRNLIDNFTKHSGTAGKNVHVSLLGEQDGMLYFQVRDDGCGFDDPSIAFLGGGDFKCETGFGLLGVKRIVSARGGEISAEVPENGIGAQIVFTLPGALCDPSAIAEVDATPAQLGLGATAAE